MSERYVRCFAPFMMVLGAAILLAACRKEQEDTTAPPARGPVVGVDAPDAGSEAVPDAPAPPAEDVDTAAARTAKPELPAGSITPTEKTSFDAVAQHLDPGGAFYAYLSSEKWGDALLEWMVLSHSLIVAEMNDEGGIDKVDRVFSLLHNIVADGGLTELSGMGMSSIATGPSLYHNKAVFHHYPGMDRGLAWRLVGTDTDGLIGLDYMPATTVAASYGAFDIEALWQWLTALLRDSGIPEVQQGLDGLRAGLSQFGVDLDALIASTDGRVGAFLTVDPANHFPFQAPGGQSVQIPDVGLVIMLAVKDDSLLQIVDKLTANNPGVVRTDEDGLAMRTMPMALPVPLKISPTLAQKDGMLMIASNEGIAQAALAVKAGTQSGLKDTDELKRLRNRLPTEGVGFCFVSKRLRTTVEEVIPQFLDGQDDDGAALIKDLFASSEPAESFEVVQADDEGIRLTSNSTRNGGQAIMIQMAATPLGLLGAIAVPSFIKARQVSQKNGCINNLRIIDAAKEQCAIENNDDVTKWAEYVKRGAPACPTDDSAYTPGALGTDPTCPNAGLGHVMP